MFFNASNFLYFVKQLVTGRNGDDTPVAGGLLPGSSPTQTSSESAADGGIKVDQVVPLTDVVVTSTGVSPVLVFESGISAIATASGAGPAIGTFSFAIPRDYDEASDHLVIYLTANSTNSDASITITGTPSIAHIASQLATSTAIVATTGTAVTATAPFNTAALNVTKEVQVFAINLSGNSLKRNDIVAVALAFAGTTTGTDYVYSVFRHYDSCIVSYNETDATDDPNNDTVYAFPSYTGTETEFGNPLR